MNAAVAPREPRPVAGRGKLVSGRVSPRADPTRVEVDETLPVVTLGVVTLGSDDRGYAVAVVVEVVHLAGADEVRIDRAAGGHSNAELTRIRTGGDAGNRRAYRIAACIVENRVAATLRHKPLRHPENLRREQGGIPSEKRAYGPPDGTLSLRGINRTSVSGLERRRRWGNVAKHVVEVRREKRRDVPKFRDQLGEERKERVPHPSRITIESEARQEVPQLRLRQNRQILIRPPELRHLRCRCHHATPSQPRPELSNERRNQPAAPQP